MKYAYLIRGLGLSLLLAFASAPTIHAVVDTGLVVNGTFETGDFTGWTQTGNQGFSGVDASNPYSGVFAAFFGPQSPGGITQATTLATTAGSSYVLSYVLSNGGGAPNSFSVSWDGVPVAGASLADSGAFPYTQYTFDLVALDSSTTLSFEFLSLPSFWWLDDVSVLPKNQVPDGGNILGMLCLAGIGIGVLRRKFLGKL